MGNIGCLFILKKRKNGSYVVSIPKEFVEEFEMQDGDKFGPYRVKSRRTDVILGEKTIALVFRRKIDEKSGKKGVYDDFNDLVESD